MSGAMVVGPSVVAEIDLWRVAKPYLERFGEDSAVRAGIQADRCLDSGDTEGAVVCRRIVEAIRRLEADKPPGGTRHLR